MQCLNLSNKEVKAAVDELTAVLGSENAAYYIISENNGYAIDLAPNGAKSKLFSDLLSYYNDDRKAAIQAKAKVFSESFKTWFGDWLSENKTDVSKVVDENGEPMITYHTSDTRNIDEFLDSQSVEINVKEEWVTDMTIDDYEKEGYVVTEKDRENYDNGESVILYKSNAIYTTDNAEMSKSYSVDELTLFEAREDYVISNENSITESYALEKEAIYDDFRRFYDNGYNNADYAKLFWSLQQIDQYSLFIDNYTDKSDKYAIAEAYLSKEMSRRYPNGFRELIRNDYNPEGGIIGEQYPLYCSIKNPLIVDANNRNWNTIIFEGNEVSTRDLEQIGRERGYDGVIVRNVYDYGAGAINYYGKLTANTVYENYKPNQIKSIDNQGTFSLSDDNIYHHLGRVKDNENTFTEQRLINSGLIHRFDNALWINKNVENGLQQVSEMAALTHATVIPYPTKGGTIVRILESANFTVLDAVKNKDTKDIKQIEHVVAFLKLRFPNIQVEFIAADYKTGDPLKDNASGWQLGSKVYLREGKITSETAIEEMLHPIVTTLQYDNRQLFYSLLEEAKKDFKELWSNIEASYTTKRGFTLQDRDNELVTQALSKYFKQSFDRNETTTFADLVKQFVDWIAQMLRLAMSPLRHTIKVINPSEFHSLTLQDLARIINTSDTRFLINQDYTDRKYHIELDKSVDKIKKGIKQRLNSIKRYQTKNLDVIYTEEKLLDDLNKLDSIEGIVEFVDYVNKSLNDATSFLDSRPEEINSRLLVQLKRDYLSFFIPMIRDIQFIIDTTSILADSVADYDLFKATVDRIVTRQTSLMNKYDNILRSAFRSTVKEYAEAHGSLTVEQMMNWLDDPSKDLNWLEYFIGLTSAANNEVVRIMADILNTSINETKRNTYDHGVGLVDLYNAAKEAHPSLNVMSLMQEKDKNGHTTGYFTRDLNYGQFYADQKVATDKIIEELGITRDTDGRLLFESNEQQREYRKRKNAWQLKHGELKYTKEYYDLKFSLSVEAQDALNEIDSLVSNILSKYKEHTLHKITTKDKANLDNLSRLKAELYSEYYADGSKKSGTELAIAKELQLFRKKLSKKINYKRDYKKFNQTAAVMIARYGVKSEEYKKWVANATEIVYTEEFFEDIEARSTKNPALEEYYEERSRLLAMYRNQGTREITMEIPDEIKDRIRELDKLISDKSTPKAEDAPSVSEIAEFKRSEKYYEDMRIAKEEGRYEEWYNQSHYEDKKGNLRTVSYYTYMKPINERKYTKSQPNSYFSMLDLDSEFANSNYDLNGEYVQPKRSLYDNSKAFSEIQNNSTIKALYDALIGSMQSSYGKISFMDSANPYKLPQISGRMMSVISRADNKFEAMKYLIKDSLVVKDDDTDFIEKFDQRNDGSQVKLIPTRYIQMLEDPSKITSDVVGSVIQFFEMAENFKNMQSIQDDLEMMLYGLSDLSINKGKKVVAGTDSNVYKKAADLLDMVLYGEKKQRLTVKGVDVTKGLQKIYGYVSLTNLANNMWAMIANYGTGQVNLDIEAVAGKYFDASDLHFAKKEYLRRLPKITANIGNVNHKDKLTMLMLKNQVTRSNQETFDRLDQSRVLRGINQHFWYNGYTAGDFTIKSQLLMAVYHSMKYYKGEYLTEQQFLNKYYPKSKKDGRAAFKAISDTLWDAYDVVEGKLVNVAKNALKLAAEKAFELALKKINALATRIDGNIGDTDRAAIHRNVITQFLVMHRNFMINGIQERFKAKQFNYNTCLMEGGMYADAAQFVWHSLRDGKFKFLKQAYTEWDNMDELERYNVKKVSIELANIAMWGALTSFLLVAAADDEPEDWALQAIAYSATRMSFEFRTMYNPFELMSLLNSPSAAVSWSENAGNMLKLLWIPNYFTEGGPFEEVKSGVYKGYSKILRNIVKLSPVKNIVEATSVEGIKSKRNYLENQLAF